MRRMDITDLKKKRAPMGKIAYVVKIKTMIKSTKAQRVAIAIAGKLRSSCKQVAKRGVAAADN